MTACSLKSVNIGATWRMSLVLSLENAPSDNGRQRLVVQGQSSMRCCEARIAFIVRTGEDTTRGRLDTSWKGRNGERTFPVVVL